MLHWFSDKQVPSDLKHRGTLRFQHTAFDFLNYPVSDDGLDAEKGKWAFTEYLPYMLGTLCIHSF